MFSTLLSATMCPNGKASRWLRWFSLNLFEFSLVNRTTLQTLVLLTFGTLFVGMPVREACAGWVSMSHEAELVSFGQISTEMSGSSSMSTHQPQREQHSQKDYLSWLLDGVQVAYPAQQNSSSSTAPTGGPSATSPAAIAIAETMQPLLTVRATFETQALLQPLCISGIFRPPRVEC